MLVTRAHFDRIRILTVTYAVPIVQCGSKLPIFPQPNEFYHHLIEFLPSMTGLCTLSLDASCIACLCDTMQAFRGFQPFKLDRLPQLETLVIVYVRYYDSRAVNWLSLLKAIEDHPRLTTLIVSDPVLAPGYLDPGMFPNFTTKLTSLALCSSTVTNSNFSTLMRFLGNITSLKILQVIEAIINFPMLLEGLTSVKDSLKVLAVQETSLNDFGDRQALAKALDICVNLDTIIWCPPMVTYEGVFKTRKLSHMTLTCANPLNMLPWLLDAGRRREDIYLTSLRLIGRRPSETFVDGKSDVDRFNEAVRAQGVIQIHNISMMPWPCLPLNLK